MTDLSKKTPAQIDTEIARIGGLIGAQTGRIGDARRAIALAKERINQGASDAGKQPAAIEAAEAEIAAAEAAIVSLREEIAPYKGQYEERRWTRYYLVNNSNGHIHKNLNCSTCFVTTEYSWLFECSGRTPEDLISEYGEDVCSECYPQAPVLANGFRKSVADKQAVSCDGNGEYHGDVARPGWAGFVVAPQVACKVCGERAAITKGGKIRRHDTPAERLRKEKAKSPEKIVVGRETYKTRRAAEIALSQGCKVEGGKLVPNEHAQAIADILAERDGVLVEVILKPFAKKVVARDLRHAREGLKYLRGNCLAYGEGTSLHAHALKQIPAVEKEIEDLKAAQKALRAA
jgi:hypothetical protein